MELAMFKSKWFIAFMVILLTLIILYFLGRKSVHSELVIAAPAEEIWKVLMDKNNYHEWNTVLIPIEGELREGEKLKYKMIGPGEKESIVGAKVIKLKKNRLLNQYGGIPGVLTFDHKYILESAEGGTKLTIHEDYRGVGVLFWNPAWVEEAYIKTNEALRDRVSENDSRGG